MKSPAMEKARRPLNDCLYPYDELPTSQGYPSRRSFKIVPTNDRQGKARQGNRCIAGLSTHTSDMQGIRTASGRSRSIYTSDIAWHPCLRPLLQRLAAALLRSQCLSRHERTVVVVVEGHQQGHVTLHGLRQHGRPTVPTVRLSMRFARMPRLDNWLQRAAECPRAALFAALAQTQSLLRR